jgi:hypothetical protein
MPLVPRPGPSTSQAIREGLAEFLAPSANGLIRDNNASFSQEQLNVPQAETEDVMQPDRMTDNLGGKAMTVVWIGWRVHATSLVGRRSRRQTSLT